MAKKHTLDLYAHLEGTSCFGCVEVEEQDAATDAPDEASERTEPEPAPAAGPGETGPLPEEPDDPKPLGWIEIELVGEGDVPVAGKRVEITLPDGKVVAGATDARGVVRLARIPQGGCQVRFPEIDDRLIEAL